MDALKSKYHNISKGGFFLDLHKENLCSYLIEHSWLKATDIIQKIEIPGEGNMNLVLRIIPGDAKPFIVKQARPWVEKYPDLEAPMERIVAEFQYYRYISEFPALGSYSPGIMGFDKINSLMVLEDLGHARDFSFVYQKDNHFSREQLKNAIGYLNLLKQLPPPDTYPSNLPLRKLNHQHIFHLPFVPGAIDLEKIQPDLVEMAAKCQQDSLLTSRITSLGEVYLSKGNYLLHGDFYPGSLLKSADGLKVIDPEFSFIGPEEWDIAVFMAHLILSGSPGALLAAAWSAYEQTADFDNALFAGFTGTEILRRLLGLAQVPLELPPDEKIQLIEQASSWIKTGKIDTLSGYEVPTAGN